MTPIQNISLCIPRVKINDYKTIKSIFEKLNFGKIKRIDIVENKPIKPTDALAGTWRVFVHYFHWYENDQTLEVQYRLNNDFLVAVVYNAPWYWRIKIAR